MRYKISTLKKLFRSFKNGNCLKQACQDAEIGVSTYFRWIEKNPNLRLKLDKMKAGRNDLVVNALFKKALTGDTPACKAWLQNQANWSFSEQNINVNAQANASAESKAETIIDPEEARTRLQDNIELLTRHGILNSEASKN